MGGDGLVIYNVQTDEILCTLDYEQYEPLYEIFDQYYYHSGLIIDFYGDITMNPSQVQNLLDFIEKSLKTSSNEQQKNEAVKFKGFLTNCVAQKITLRFSGP